MRAIQLALVLLLALHLVAALPDRHDHDGDHGHGDHDHDDDDDYETVDGTDDDDDDDEEDQSKDESKRLCPDGYAYAGDDTPHIRDYSLEEVDRSPVYSCYKIISTTETWISANLKCIDDDAQLASFEDVQEMKRFRRKFRDPGHETYELLTSAIHFGKEATAGWVWVGSNSTLAPALFEASPADNLLDVDHQCLVLHMEYKDSNSTYLKSVNCMDSHSTYVCEARVQTVTYYAWFMANWFTFLLIFLLIVLVLSLCVSMTMYGKKSGRRERVYRGQSRQINDLPPSYKDTTNQQSRLDQYRNKGKDLLAKVYLYKEESKVAPRH